MRKVLLIAAAVVMVLAAVTSVLTWANRTKKEIVGLTPEQVRWFLPPGILTLSIQAKAARGSIELRYLAASVCLRIHIRKTNSSQ